MANATARRRVAKRAVMAAAPVADVIDLEPEESFEDETPNFALKLTEALDAIAAAQPDAVPATYSRPMPKAHKARPAAPAAARPAIADTAPAPPPAPAVSLPAAVVRDAVSEPATSQVALAETAGSFDLDAEDVADAAELGPKPANAAQRFLHTLDKLPPIKLPIGPAIPWRIGLPLLVALTVAMFLMARPSAAPTPTDKKLPGQEAYAVQQDSPLFAKADPTPAPIGVQEPTAGMNIDVMDLGIKFIAVLALAYGSLIVLKKTGLGGAAGGAKGSSSMTGVRVVSSMVLAPNRTVHVIRTPGGKSLLLGATPQQVNLIADLGELDDEALGTDTNSFFDILASKLPR